MILEEATHEAYGYYPSDLKPQSHKHILAVCDNCGNVKTTSKNQYYSLCRSCARKGKKPPMFGKHHTEEHKAAMKGNTYALGHTCTENQKAIHSATMKGENHWNWRGGISFEPYCVKFNNAFKEYIRAKFEYKCFLCPITQEENGKKLSIHHVNYNKNCGCDGDLTCQFVPLCKSCHSKTNGNREHWQKIITNKLHSTIIGWVV